MNNFVESILNTPLDAKTKGIPVLNGDIRLGDVGKQNWNVLRGDMMLPVLTLREERMTRNLTLMRAFAEHHGVCLAPHGKSTLCPQLYLDQLEIGGCWGITAATVQQAYVIASSGVTNIIIANEVVSPANIRTLAELKKHFQDVTILSLVDSVETLDQLVEHGGPELAGGMRFQVLIEVGYRGGRKGVRTMDRAIEVIEAARTRTNTIELRGIEAYEGTINLATPDETIVAVDAFLDFVVAVLGEAKSRDALHQGAEVLLTAGGSAYFDRVVAKFAPAHSGPGTRIALRGGSYLTYDHGFYKKKLRDLDERGGLEGPEGHINATRDFLPALELWAMVESLQDPGVAIMTMGIRDLPYDLGYPTPLRQYRGGELFRDVESEEGVFEITNSNDQHCYLKFAQGTDIRVGDVLSFGISHPCTAFDKWDVLYKVDEDYNVTHALKTFF